MQKNTKASIKQTAPKNPSLDTSTYSNAVNYNDAPQIINAYATSPFAMDTDVERFRIRLEDMLNRFRLDSMTEIMETKRGLLADQQRFMAAERQVNNDAVSDLQKEAR